MEILQATLAEQPDFFNNKSKHTEQDTKRQQSIAVVNLVKHIKNFQLER